MGSIPTPATGPNRPQTLSDEAVSAYPGESPGAAPNDAKCETISHFEGTCPTPAPRKSVRTYCLHKQSGCGRAVWTDATGTRQFKLLPGAFESSESRTAFATLLLELEAAPAAVTAPAQGMALAEVMGAYLQHAGRHDRGADGKPTSEFNEIKSVVKALREMYAETPAAEEVCDLRRCDLDMTRVRRPARH